MPNQRPSSTDATEPSKSEAGIDLPVVTEPTPQLPIAMPVIATPTDVVDEEERAIDEHLMQRIENLPKDAGWALITAGVIGLISPGVIGWPFVVAGAFVLTPGGTRKLARWAARKPRKHAHAALRQICRLVDDLERRYPSVRADGAPVVLQHRSYIDVQ
jgi:hypothetical protein